MQFKLGGRSALAGIAVGALIGAGLATVTPAGAVVKSAAAAIDWKQVWQTEIKPRADKRYYTKKKSNARYYAKWDANALFETKAAHDASLANYYTKAQSDANYYTKAQSDANYYTKAQADNRYRQISQTLSASSDERFAILYPLAGGTVGRLAIRGDASIRDASDPAATVTKLGTGQYCITAPGAQEGAVGSLQNQGGGQLGTIRVSMGIGSICNAVAGSNITVETFRIN
jgi:hypothetical protein